MPTLVPGAPTAEDALSEALVAALAAWPRDGVPNNPDAWLMTAARRRIIDRARSERVRADAVPTLELLADVSTDAEEPHHIPDERLKLLFVCAHPAIDSTVHTALMLQVVLGLSAEAIARAFVISPATMGQRLVRAKAKIQRAGISFEVPDARELPKRLEAVLHAIYAAYGSGWEDAADSGSDLRGLAEEAIWLAKVLRDRMPDEPEVRGLLALMLHCEARRPARRSVDGRFVPLSDQDTRLWNASMIEEAEHELAIASGLKCPGRFQLEAAIQSVHAERRHTGITQWDAIVAFYETLVLVSPTLGALIGRAAAVAEVKGPARALPLLDQIDPKLVTSYQPYWAVRAHLLALIGRRDEAAETYDRAIGLSDDDAVRRFLLERRLVAASARTNGQ